MDMFLRVNDARGCSEIYREMRCAWHMRERMRERAGERERETLGTSERWRLLFGRFNGAAGDAADDDDGLGFLSVVMCGEACTCSSCRIMMILYERLKNVVAEKYMKI